MSAAVLERALPWIRAQFPQLAMLRDGTPRVYLDNAAGTLLPESVAEAMREAALWRAPQPDRRWPPSPETRELHRRARRRVAAFLNAGEEDPIFFSESTTASLYKLREGLEPRLEPGTNVLVTDCDHYANVTPWEWRAHWEVRRLPMAPDGAFELEALRAWLDGQTRLVALTLASNGLGTILPVEAAIPIVRERAPEAVVVVDAVHAAPHLPIDVARLGADALAFSAYKLFGPFCGVLWLRPSLLERLDPYRVEPHVDPETRLEWGTLDSARVAGVEAALLYLQRLGERLEPAMVGQWTEYPRDRRLFKLALAAIREREAALSARILAEIAELPGVTLFGVAEPERASDRVPTFAFRIAGVPDAELEARFWDAEGMQLAVGSHYSAAVRRGLGLNAVARASFAHYNTAEEAEAFLRALRFLADG